MTTSRQRGLQHAVSVIFALVAVVPLLIFTWTLYVLDVIARPAAQIGLALALVIALLGFSIFRSLLRQISDMIRLLGSAVEQAGRLRRAAAVASPTTVPTTTPAAVPPPPAPAGLTAATPATAAPTIGGIGNILEFGEMARTMALLWKHEAQAHIGRAVAISVANAPEPVRGTLIEVTDEGVLLQQGDRAVPITFSRVRAIELGRD